MLDHGERVCPTIPRWPLHVQSSVVNARRVSGVLKEAVKRLRDEITDQCPSAWIGCGAGPSRINAYLQSTSVRKLHLGAVRSC